MKFSTSTGWDFPSSLVLITTGDTDWEVVQQFTVSFRGQRPGLLCIFIRRRQIIDFMVDDGRLLVSVGGFDADRVVTDMVKHRVEGKLACGVQVRDVQVRNDIFGKPRMIKAIL